MADVALNVPFPAFATSRFIPIPTGLPLQLVAILVEENVGSGAGCDEDHDVTKPAPSSLGHRSVHTANLFEAPVTMGRSVVALRGLLEKSPDADLLREVIGFAAQRLMARRAAALTGAGFGEKSPERQAQRNG